MSKVAMTHGETVFEMNQEPAEDLVKLLNRLGYEDDENLKDTPKRFSKALDELVMSRKEIKALCQGYTKVAFKSKYHGLVILTNAISYGLCPHHLLPVRFTVDLAYFAESYVVGLSKLARIVEVCTKGLFLQEELTQYIADRLDEIKGCNGSMVKISGWHNCMAIRGIRKDEASAKTIVATKEIGNSMSLKEECMNAFKA